MRRGVAVAGVSAALVGAMTGIASAAPGDSSSDTTTANVQVTSAIALTGLTPSFTLVGLPGATVTGLREVNMNVATNNLAGYAVTVQSEAATMAPNSVTNPDSIPIGALKVRESGGGAYTSLSSAGAVTVHSQTTRSAQGGDSLSNDYQVAIPFVNEDTYSATLDYVATTL